MHRSSLKIFIACLVLAACAGKAKGPETPKVPVPPREPLAWLPEDGSVAGQVVLAPFQNTPLWGVWQQLLQDPAAQSALFDASKIQRVGFAGSDTGSKTASFVAAVSGTFTAGELDALAKARNVAPEPHGLLTFYRAEHAAYAQPYPELILVCSFDRVDALATRAGQGDRVAFAETALYRSLAERLKWRDSDVVIIGEDPRGELKGRAQERAQRYGFAFSAQDLVRAGVALKLGPSVALLATLEATGEAQAQAFKATIDSTLAGLENNLLMGLLGIRPLIKALATTQDKNYVAVGGNLANEDFNRVLERLAGMLGVALSQGAPPAQDAAPPAAP